MVRLFIYAYMLWCEMFRLFIYILPEQFAVNLRNNGINGNAILIDRGAVIMEIKY